MSGANFKAENPENSEIQREFLDGSHRGVADLPSMFVGLGHYKRGWRWSEHVGKQTGKPADAHIGYVVSGSMVIQSPEGEEYVVTAGEAFEIGPNHDAWVVGDEPCIALDFEVKTT